MVKFVEKQFEGNDDENISENRLLNLKYEVEIVHVWREHIITWFV